MKKHQIAIEILVDYLKELTQDEVWASQNEEQISELMVSINLLKDNQTKYKSPCVKVDSPKICDICNGNGIIDSQGLCNTHMGIWTIYIPCYRCKGKGV